MTDKENLNDTKYLLEETDYKNTTNNNIEEQNLKNTLLNNTQLLLEEKSSIIYDIPNDINNIIQNQPKIEVTNKKDENLKKPEQENSIKDILIKNVNENYNEENEKIKDEQEIIKQQNILLNNQSTHLDELFSLSYPDFIHNRNINFTNNLYNNKIIYFGVLFPTEKVIKTINYKNKLYFTYSNQNLLLPKVYLLLLYLMLTIFYQNHLLFFSFVYGDFVRPYILQHF